MERCSIRKVMLVQPSLHSLSTLQNIMDGNDPRDFDTPKYTFPIGLLHIASVLEDRGYEVRILDLDKEFYSFLRLSRDERGNVNSFFERCLVHQVAQYQPDVVGISGNFTCNRSTVIECCIKLKDLDKGLPIVLGGHYPTNCFTEIFEGGVRTDYVVLGEGEQVMADLVVALGNGDRDYIEKHPNIVVRENIRSGVVKDKKAAIIRNLDSLPSVNYELLDIAEDYICNTRNVRTIFERDRPNRSIAMMTSRGCPNRCVYCASHRVHGRKIRAFSVQRVLNDLEDAVRRYDINALIIEDDLFTFSRKRTIRLCKEIYRRFGDRFFIEFSNGIAVKTLNEECIYWLVKAGMKQIHLAIESGNQYVQDEVIKKKLNLGLVKPVVEILRKYDVIIRAFFIIGFPGESIEMMRDTKRFAKEIKVDWAIFSFASPVAGSELYESAKRNNQLVSADSDAATYFDSQLTCDDWSQEDVEKVQEEANYEVNFLENYNLVEDNFEKSRAIFADICRGYPRHLIAHYCLWKAQVGLEDMVGARGTEERIFDILQNDDGSRNIVRKYDLAKVEPFNRSGII